VTELAIWMAGGTPVPIFPTETAETLRIMLDNCEARLLFAGKLDNLEEQKAGTPGNQSCIALPLAPASKLDSWDSMAARTDPLAGRPARADNDVAMLL